MSQKKQQVRELFRNTTFKRDGYKCAMCGFEAHPPHADAVLDAHHITNREAMPGGGYVKENGISLCKFPRQSGEPSCHYKAETFYIDPMTCPTGFTPAELYAKIGSTYEKAMEISQRKLVD